jgi:hypothetical protein
VRAAWPVAARATGAAGAGPAPGPAWLGRIRRQLGAVPDVVGLEDVLAAAVALGAFALWALALAVLAP